MTTEKLLEKLRAERVKLDTVILYIERLSEGRQAANKAKDILDTVNGASKKRGPYKKKHIYHWTQTAAGKRKMSKAQKLVWARKRAEELK